MQRNRGGKNIKFLKKACVLAIAIILISSLIIPTIYSAQITNNLNQTEKQNKEKTTSNNNWWNNSWPYRKLITIDHNQITNNQTNFPFLLHISSDTNLSDCL